MILAITVITTIVVCVFWIKTLKTHLYGYKIAARIAESVLSVILIIAIVIFGKITSFDDLKEKTNGYLQNDLSSKQIEDLKEVERLQGKVSDYKWWLYFGS